MTPYASLLGTVHCSLKVAGFMNFVAQGMVVLGSVEAPIAATVGSDYSISAYNGILDLGAGLIVLRSALFLESCAWAKEIIGGEPCEVTTAHVGDMMIPYALYREKFPLF